MLLSATYSTSKKTLKIELIEVVAWIWRKILVPKFSVHYQEESRVIVNKAPPIFVGKLFWGCFEENL